MADPEGRFTELYEGLYPRVHAYAVTRVGRGLAEEVAHETFLVAWRKFDRLPDRPLPWLLGVARNVVRETYREEVRRRALEEEMARWVRAEEDVADGVTERAAVLRGLAGLSDGDRELLTLVAWQGLTPAEAAEVLGCTTATYFVKLHRARRRLEKALPKERVR
ncbi:RNA polymerase sigma factor [Herbidospora sp. RD11066]